MTAGLRKQTDRFAEAVIDDEIVLMDVETGRFLSMRDSAATIWRLIDGEADRDALLARLEAMYAGSPDAMASDLDAFLARLREAHFVA